MPKIYMSDNEHSGGGTMFCVRWDRIEDFLRGKPDVCAGSSAFVKSDETCEFVVTSDGIKVYVEPKK